MLDKMVGHLAFMHLLPAKLDCPDSEVSCAAALVRASISSLAALQQPISVCSAPAFLRLLIETRLSLGSKQLPKLHLLTQQRTDA